MIRMVAGIALLLLMLCGCTAAGYRAVNPADYGQVRKNFDVTLGWNLQPAADRLVIVGYVRNNRYYQMRDLMVTVTLLAMDGTERARETVFVHPSELRIDELTGFSVTLPRKPARGEQLRFLYRYLAVEGSDESQFWMNSFDVPAVQE